MMLVVTAVQEARLLIRSPIFLALNMELPKKSEYECIIDVRWQEVAFDQSPFEWIRFGQQSIRCQTAIPFKNLETTGFDDQWLQEPFVDLDVLYEFLNMFKFLESGLNLFCEGSLPPARRTE